jgi:hypothetical protein
VPNFQIKIINDTFKASNHEELADMEAAKSQALKGGLEIGAEKILTGAPVFVAEVIVADEHDRQRFVVTIATSPLL